MGVYLSVVNSGENWRSLSFGLLAVILVVVEAVAGSAQVRTGATLTGQLLLKWESDFRAGDPGASYLLNAAGQPLLRAYGTTEHPNHLAGYTGVLALILLGAWLIESKPGLKRWLWGGGLVTGTALLGLTFSRGGWIAFAVSAFYLLLCGFQAPGRVAVAVSLIGGTAIIFFLLFGPWVVQRVAPLTESWLEIKSLQDRALIAEGAWDLIRARPLLGVGLGNYMQGVLAYLPEGLKAPVHNAMALAAGELGLAGGLLAVGLYVRVIWIAWRVRANLGPVVSAVIVLALLVANAFDLYAWGLAPGRLFLGLLCGLCGSDLVGIDSRLASG